jgi:hypothetical protein
LDKPGLDGSHFSKPVSMGWILCGFNGAPLMRAGELALWARQYSGCEKRGNLFSRKLLGVKILESGFML